MSRRPALPPGGSALPKLDVGVTLPVADQRLARFATGGYLHLTGQGGGDARARGWR